MLGPTLLAAPVLEYGARNRTVYENPLPISIPAFTLEKDGCSTPLCRARVHTRVVAAASLQLFVNRGVFVKHCSVPHLIVALV